MQVADVEKLVAQEISRISQRDLVEVIRRALVPPRCEPRPWDYGAPGQTYPCWIVAEDKPSNTAFVFCELGFGASYAWSLLSLRGDYLNMGMDSQWFVSLEEAFRDSRAWEGENPPGYMAS